MDYLLIQGESLSITQIASGNYDRAFLHVKDPQKRIDSGKGELWLRLTFHNEGEAKDVILESNSNYLPMMDLYARKADGSWQRWPGGLSVAPAYRQIASRSFAFSMTLPADGSVIYYLHVDPLGVYAPEFLLWDKPYQFFYAKRVEWYWIGLFFGALLALLLYNLYSLIILWRKDTFYYTLFLFSFACLFIIGQDLHVFILQNVSPYIRNMTIILLYGTTAYLMGRFSSEFLELKSVLPRFASALQRYFTFVLGASLVVMGVMTFQELGGFGENQELAIQVRQFSLSIYFLFILIIGFLLPIAGFLTARRSIRQAKLFLVSFIAFFIGITPTLFYNANLREADITDEFFLNMGAGIQLVLLSIGLADRFRLIRMENDKAQRQVIIETKRHQELQQTYTKQLEMEVSERTKTLSESLSRIEHLNGNLQRISREKSEILAVASHDLRNPIAGIRGLATLLRDELTNGVLDKENGEELLLTIEDTSERILELITNLLDLNRLEQETSLLDCEKEDMRNLVRSSIAAHRRFAENKDIIIEGVFPENECNVNVDCLTMMQAIDNLISNAIKYGPLGSKIHAYIQLTESECTFSVKDHGAGIPEEEQNKLFRKFSKLSSRPTNGEHSSGLGLAIVKRIVDLHGGHVGCRSVPGQGSTFYITLKRVWGDEPELQNVSSKGDAGSPSAL